AAEKAGIKAGDIILEFNGKPIANSAELKNFARRTEPGESARLKVFRDKKTLYVNVVIGKVALSMEYMDRGDAYYYGRGVPKDYDEAVKWYRKAADQGNADAQNNLGIIYQNGFGVAKDYEEAVKWYRKSADQGHAVAQANLGWMCENGYGIPKDYEEAVKWYRKSA